MQITDQLESQNDLEQLIFKLTGNAYNLAKVISTVYPTTLRYVIEHNKQFGFKHTDVVKLAKYYNRCYTEIYNTDSCQRLNTNFLETGSFEQITNNFGLNEFWTEAKQLINSQSKIGLIGDEISYEAFQACLKPLNYKDSEHGLSKNSLVYKSHLSPAELLGYLNESDLERNNSQRDSFEIFEKIELETYDTLIICLSNTLYLANYNSECISSVEEEKINICKQYPSNDSPIAVGQTIRNLVKLIKQRSPATKIIFSVSPKLIETSYNSSKHVLQSNLEIKFTLSRLLHSISREVDGCFYFPFLEILAFNESFKNILSLQTFTKDEVLLKEIVTTFTKQYFDTELIYEHYKGYALSLDNAEAKTSLTILNESLKLFNTKGLVDNIDYLKTMELFSRKGDQNLHNPKAYDLFRPISGSTGLELNRLQGQMFQILCPQKQELSQLELQRLHDLQANGHIIIKSENFSPLEYSVNKFLGQESLLGEDGVERPYKQILELTEQDCATNEVLRHFWKDDSIPSIEFCHYLKHHGVDKLCKAYLGGIFYTKLSGCTSIPGADKPILHNGAAQQFHFDLDNIARWLKIFIYCNEVTQKNGPHVYVEGTHSNLHSSFFSDGRFSNEHVENHYKSKIKSITGKPGDIIIVDTLGLHKGQTLVAGHRNMLSVLIANTRFGQCYSPNESNETFRECFLNS